MSVESEVSQLESLVSQLSERIELLTAQLSAVGIEDSGEGGLLASARALQSAGVNSSCNFDFYLSSCDRGLGGGSSGDTGFVILCSALVLMMTIPGLGLYYAGMVKAVHIEATILQTVSIVAITTFMFMVFGYSLSLAPATPSIEPYRNIFFGNGERLWFLGIGPTSFHELAPSIPEAVFALYQLTFAIVTHALVCGSLANRMKFYSMLLIMALWHIAVYCPVAHANWHPDGFLHAAGVMDFAGGNVVHLCSGCAGLMATIIIGKKRTADAVIEPNNVLLTYIGASLLWLGWYGFNAGSALSANARAGQALLNTQISASAGALAWLALEWHLTKKPSMMAMLSGGVAGLVCVTPACGWVDQTGAFFIGSIGSPLCYLGAYLKHLMGYDDALDAFGVHATGGLVGGILTGFFAQPSVFARYDSSASTKYHAGVFYNIGDADGEQRTQLGTQLYGVAVTALYSSVVSFAIIKMVDITVGLATPEESELLRAVFPADAPANAEDIDAGEVIPV